MNLQEALAEYRAAKRAFERAKADDAAAESEALNFVNRIRPEAMCRADRDLLRAMYLLRGDMGNHPTAGIVNEHIQSVHALRLKKNQLLAAFQQAGAILDLEVVKATDNYITRLNRDYREMLGEAIGAIRPYCASADEARALAVQCRKLCDLNARIVLFSISPDLGMRGQTLLADRILEAPDQAKV